MTQLIYDSFLTDRISGNLNNQGDKILDFNINKLNKLFWMEIKQGQNNSSFFFIVKTFSLTESTTIINAITQKENVFFDKSGNITIRDTADNSLIFKWLNPLSKNLYTASKNDNIFIQKDAIISNQKVESLPRPDLIHSNNSTWILYSKDKICYILYNPIHRRSFKNFYNTLPSSDFDDSSGNISNLFNSYCSLQRENGSSSSSVLNYADRACKCIIQEDGIDDAVGVKITDPNYRSKMRNNYFCNAPSCQVSNLEVSEDSFMYGTDSYYQRRVNKIGKCPDTNITICSLAINSAGNTNLVGTKIGQECGIKEPVVEPQVVESPVVKSPVVESPVVESPPGNINNTIVDLSSISIFIKTPIDFFNNYQQLQGSIKANIVKIDRTLSIYDIDIAVNDLSDESSSQKMYKIDITLTKQIQIVKDNIISDIMTPDLVRNFSISKTKIFESTDISDSKKSTQDMNYSLKIMYYIFGIIIILVILFLSFKYIITNSLKSRKKL